MAKRFNSRQKGNNTELKVAKILTEAWKSKFVRTPNSGAFKGLAPSDIIPESNADWMGLPYFLEIKNRVGWTLEHLISSKCQSAVLAWYLEEEKKQVEARGLKHYDKCMLLIFTKNHDDLYVMYRNEGVGVGWLPRYTKSPESALTFTQLTNDGTEITEYRILTLKDFLQCTDFQADKANYSKWLADKNKKGEVK